ncbi:hypothetical protein HN014_09265 [Aquimarina sp. TRL1]|uniref:hypothetical protein n=1 Tax=Aquimarina sp. (strain TRL1) TaxID=2736252 RepID=UPI00158D7516|nr:hypothetical protein [Aquimarina sp. TRL1]QKX05099.1 hypothetical protein HN014_09265 [Aquimarina sp. TRL1]
MKTSHRMRQAFFAVVATITLSSCEQEASTAETANVSPPEHMISLDKATTEYNNFYTTRIAPRKTATEENRSVWFDIGQLRQHLNRMDQIAAQYQIPITKLSFLLGANAQGQRTVLIAPMTFDSQSGSHRAFTIEQQQLRFLHTDPYDNYSLIASPDTETETSLVLGTSGLVSTAETVAQYNRYYDTKVVPIADQVPHDTRICFYKKGIFSAYLDYLQQQAADNQITLDGVQVVFGVYDNTPEMGAMANHQTLFFAPTETGGKNKQTISYSIIESTKVILDFSQNTLSVPSHKTGDNQSSSIMNELNGSPPRGN